MIMTATELVGPPRLPAGGACALLFFTVLLGMISRPGMALALECTDLSGAVYVTGSTAAKPILVEVAKILVAQTTPVTVVYSGQGSCAGVDAVLNGKPLYGSGTTSLSYWDMTGTEAKCTVSAASNGVIADVGMSDVFANTCFALPGGLPTNVEDFLGPIQTMTFVVPKSSPEKAISAEAAYYVFGFGSASGVTPWTDQSWILHRDEQSGTQRMIGAAIGVSPERWKGTVTSSSSELLTRLTGAGTGAAAIGILSADLAQGNRAVMNILAYQQGGQSCGYYPDRDGSGNEKSNVRDGHYAIWGPLHLFTRVTSGGYPLNPAAAAVIGYVTGTKVPPSGLDIIALEAQTHVIPQCAMRVKRVQEVGPLSSFAPVGACGCYYDKVANGTTACKPCVAPGDCPAAAPVCSYGYCETQ